LDAIPSVRALFNDVFKEKLPTIWAAKSVKQNPLGFPRQAIVLDDCIIYYGVISCMLGAVDGHVGSFFCVIMLLRLKETGVRLMISPTTRGKYLLT
jgi:hypothetical protein